MKAPIPRLLPKNTRMGLPIRANKGIEAEYKRRLQKLIGNMFASLNWWLGAEYKRQQKKILAYDADAPIWRKALDRVPAFDASPARGMRDVLRQRFRQWYAEFYEAAERYSRWFASRVNATATLSTGASITHVAGFAVKFKPTRAMNNVMQSIITRNVGLIKNIADQTKFQIEGMVMRSVISGRDLAGLQADLKKIFDDNHRRAERIARDQINKATEELSTERMKSVGITQAVWIHSGVARQPRPTHVAMHGKPFDLSATDGKEAGLYDSAVKRFVLPGEEPMCDCTKAPLVPAFSRGPKDMARWNAVGEKIRQRDAQARERMKA